MFYIKTSQYFYIQFSSIYTCLIYICIGLYIYTLYFYVINGKDAIFRPTLCPCHTSHPLALINPTRAREVHSGVEYGALRDSSGLGEQLGRADDSQMSRTTPVYVRENSALNWCGGRTAASAGAVRPTQQGVFGFVFKAMKTNQVLGQCLNDTLLCYSAPKLTDHNEQGTLAAFYKNKQIKTK